jgi:hypothetical protein
MKLSFFPVLLALAFSAASKADDVVIFKRTLKLSGVEAAEKTAPSVVGLNAVTGRLTEVQYEVIDLTNNQHAIIEVYAVDPFTGAKGYINNTVASGLGYEVLEGFPAGTQTWVNGKVFSEETSGAQTSTLHEIYEEIGKAAPTKIGTKTLTVPARITVVSAGIDQFTNSDESLRGSVMLTGTGTSVLEKKLSSNLSPTGTLADAILIVTTLLEGQGFVDLEP